MTLPTSERFVLKQQRGWFVIERHVPDADFNPPIWVQAGELGKFRSREDARLFMIARQEASHA